ncbi:MAG: hypothetical protein NTY22_07705 [Proteobacteria bacterium]|nr:hypothetical protein [Pseudomonadota bacterium]
MSGIERLERYSEYQSVLNTLINYHLSKEKKYNYIFCDHPERLGLEFSKRALDRAKGALYIDRESGFYVKKDREGNLTRWRVKEADMTAASDANFEIVVEVYLDSKDIENKRGYDISIEIDSQNVLDNNDSMLEYLSQKMRQQKGITSLENANITTIKESSEWLVYDNKIKYYVRASESKLNVYEKGTFSIIPQCKYMRVSKVGDKKYEWFGAIAPYFFILNSENPPADCLSPKIYCAGKWKVVECYTREFEKMLNQMEP